MELSKIKQRLEILWQEVEKLEAEGGGGSGDAYTKAQTDALLAEKADKSTTYTKTQVDNALSEKANAATTYTKDETNAEIQGAITDLDVSSTSATGHYIKSIEQVDGKINAVAELIDTSPTPSSTKPITSGAVYTALANKENKIETLTASGTITNATDMTDSGVGIDIPANSGIWQINACIFWDGVRPTGGQLRITFGVRTSEYLIANSISTNDEGKNFMYLPLYACVETTPYYPSDADQTIHVKVWGKAASATGTNRVYIVAKQIKT